MEFTNKELKIISDWWILIAHEGESLPEDFDVYNKINKYLDEQETNKGKLQK